MRGESEVKVIRPLAETTEYLYGRISVPDRAAARFMNSDGRIFRFDEETATASAIVYAYCPNRAEAAEFARDVFALGVELRALGEDLLDFVKNHESDKWPD